MITLITSENNSPDSKMDQHFGRSTYFVFHDSETGGIEFLPNPFRHERTGAGESAVQLSVTRKVSRIVTAELGSKIKPILDNHGIQVIIYRDFNKTIREIIEMLQSK